MQASSPDDIAVYMFANALTTVFAVIFLYGAQTTLATISIVQMDEAGTRAAAAAMATVIVLMALGVKLLHWCSAACKRGVDRKGCP